MARPGARAAEQAVRTGEVPTDTAPWLLRDRLLETRRELRHTRAAAPVLAVLAGAGAFVTERVGLGELGWFLVAVLAASAVAYRVLGDLRLRRVDRVLAELAARGVE